VPGWRLLSIIVAVAVMLIVLEMMRRRQLREKYAGIWLVVGLGGVVFGVFPGVAEALAEATGILTAANLVFLITGVVLLVVALQLSSEVGRLEEEVRTIVEELALLRCELDDAQRQLNARIDGGLPTAVPAAAVPAGAVPATAAAAHDNG
jgi:hypothetical protein